MVDADPPPMSPGEPCWSDPAVLLATCGGLGRVPFAPGTFGAAAGLPLALAGAAIASRLAGAAPWARPFEAVLVAAVCLLGVPICTRAARRLGGKDPGCVVFDELASMPLALLVVPPTQRTPLVLAGAFVLLRIFDIAKPFPCRHLERLPGGLGIMADDWAAAAWTAACLAAALWLQVV
ncbi:MAG: phosphatidylglycerophosphatase A [Planctomycetia bacterium]|nr:phosphatidylglycerophosphatase A [Planctomycetia bacterium]